MSGWNLSWASVIPLAALGAGVGICLWLSHKEGYDW